MRRLGFVALMALAFCTEQNHIVVHAGKLDDVTRPDVGDDFEIIHMPVGGYTTQKPGFYTVHDESGWFQLWTDPRPDAKPPPPPRDVDFSKDMLFVAVAQTPGARSIAVTKAVGTNSGLQVYLAETLSGPNCPVPPNMPPPIDIVVIKSVPYDVHVHHDRVHADECGSAPDAIALCRVAGSGQEGAAKMSSQAGQIIDCDSRKSAPRTGAIVDRGWQLSAVPPGSTTKLTVGANGMGVTFALDAWGTYSLDLEVRDSARVGTTVATIDAPPPETGVPIELHWTSVDRTDDASMFPRVELHVADDRGGDCGPSKAQTWCDPKSTGTVQQIALRPEAGKTYRAYVSYQDFRLKGSPIACVRTFPKGRPSVVTCDDVVRNAGTTWDVGLVDEATTTIYDPRKGKPAPYTAPPPPPTATATATAPPPPPPTATATVKPPPPPPPPTATATVKPPPPPPPPPSASATAKPYVEHANPFAPPPPPTSPVEHKNPF
jgi:hypothetical protein